MKGKHVKFYCQLSIVQISFQLKINCVFSLYKSTKLVNAPSFIQVQVVTLKSGGILHSSKWNHSGLYTSPTQCTDIQVIVHNEWACLFKHTRPTSTKHRAGGDLKIMLAQCRLNSHGFSHEIRNFRGQPTIQV